MGYSVVMPITPRAAAKLLISGEIDISADISYNSAKEILDEVIKLQVDECLEIIDMNRYGDVADVRYIPQFGKIETVMRVPHCFADKGIQTIDSPRLGFYLKPDVKASLQANTKYGENHGKAAFLLGIADYVDKRFVHSAFTYAFCSYGERVQKEILLKLFFRVPIVQIILKAAAKGEFNGFEPMRALMPSTRIRRASNLRPIFNMMTDYGDEELNRRINNIFWENV